jgi:hypothetical protein
MTTNITTTTETTTVVVEENIVRIELNNAGVQGIPGAAGVGYTGVTSTSSVPVVLGLHTWTVANVGAFLPGMRIRAIHTDTPSIWLEGQANVASGTTIIITADKVSGSGTHNTWKFAVAGEIGLAGSTGASGVVAVTSPITNTGSASSAIVGIDQTLLSITRSQVSDFTSGTVASAGTAQQAGTAVYATNSGTAVYATTSGTAVFATNSGTAVNISGTVTQSQVTNLVSDLALKAPLASPTFSGTVTLPFASSGLLQSGTAGAILKSDPAPGLGYIPYTASTSGNYAWLDLNLVAREDIANAFTVGGHSITSEGTAIVPLVIKGASGQSASLQEWQNTGGTTIAQITSGGSLQSSGNVTAGTLTALGRLTVVSGSTATIGAVIRGAASQSANLQEWQNSGGTALASIDATGIIRSFNAFQGTGFLNTSGQTVISIATQRNVGLATGSGSYGGGQAVVFIGNATAVPSSDPTGGGIIYVDAGALKYKGTSGTAATIVNANGSITAADATVTTAANGVGYMGLPQNSTTTGSYTIVAADAGEHVYASATRTITIPANASVAFPVGTTLTFIAGAGATMTIAITTDTMYLAGAGTTGSRTLAAHGIATAVKTTSTTWLISGNGLS